MLVSPLVPLSAVVVMASKRLSFCASVLWARYAVYMFQLDGAQPDGQLDILLSRRLAEGYGLHGGFALVVIATCR